MKVSRLVIGIISIVLFFLVSFQSCAAGLGNALEDNGEVSGTAGFMLACCMLIAGIVGICCRKSNTPLQAMGHQARHAAEQRGI